jgi:endonuclease
MRNDYKAWLEEQQYDPGTVVAQLHRAGRVEDFYGDLEAQYKSGDLQAIVDELRYSAGDERHGKANPSKIKFVGNIRKNLASYKSAVVLYRKFLSGGWERSDIDVPLPVAVLNESSVYPATDQGLPDRQRFSLERDMQAMLRRDILSLGNSLEIIDDGAERSVDSGLIDITCRDSKDNSIVVVELKADKADSRAIGQILGYMGDVSVEEEGRPVSGILVAHDFDKRARAAARVVPTLRLVKYSVTFRFESVE